MKNDRLLPLRLCIYAFTPLYFCLFAFLPLCLCAFFIYLLIQAAFHTPTSWQFPAALSW